MNQKFFKALISFTLVLLMPPFPFKNDTVEVNSYLDALLKSDKHQLQSLLFASIVATTNS